MWGKFKARLIADARYWYKMWSSWLALAWGAIVTFFWNDPTMLNQVLVGVPPDMRASMSPLIFLAASALPIIVRLLKQKPHA